MLCNHEAEKLQVENDYEGLFQHILLNTDHPVFTLGELCPIPRLCGIPILLYSGAVAQGLDPGEDGDNRPSVGLKA
jgi:hypothetical protein